MRIELKIASRYLFSRRKEVFLFLSTVISVLGITIGVGALLITLSVMNGFHTDLRNKFLATTSAINVLLPQSYEQDEWRKLLSDVRKVSGVKGAAPYLLSQAVFTKRSRSQGVGVKGVETADQKKVSTLEKQIKSGKYYLPRGSIIIGSELSRSFGLSPGDSVFLTVPPAEMTGIAGGRVREFKVEGVFSSGLWEYDMNLVYVNLKEMQELYGVGSSLTGLEVSVDNVDKCERVANSIREILPFRLWVRTWRDTNRTLFSALALEKKAMFFILSLIVMVAVFNIISSLLLQTIEKIRDIGVLKAIGADAKFIKRVFTYQGLMNGLTGVVIGNVFAVSVCLLFQKYQIIKIPSEVYYIDRLPIIMFLRDFVVVNIVSVLLIFLASYIPAREAGKLSPANILRNE